ncbi:MAG: TatD family hydrolase [Candidatus Eremiobacteraeota bacterium]|nr:TatD family hydrolase [Candidatus Eremiobacteraeota bacterium]
MLSDSHAHLDDEAFADDLPVVIKRAKEQDIKYIVSPGVDISSIERVLSISKKYPDMVIPAAGIHPHEAKHGMIM